MAWHYALDTRSEADSYFCEKTLRNYRRLFIEQGLDEMLFRRLTDRLVQAFSVDTSRQRMDSTALRSAMRAQTRLGIVVETISKFARELERRHPGLCRLIDDDVIARYVVREGEGCFANTAPSVSKRRLGEAGQDLLALAVQFRNHVAAKIPDEPGPSAHSRHARHALRRPPARPWPQYLPLRCHRTMKIETPAAASAKNGVFMERQRED